MWSSTTDEGNKWNLRVYFIHSTVGMVSRFFKKTSYHGDKLFVNLWRNFLWQTVIVTNCHVTICYCDQVLLWQIVVWRNVVWRKDLWPKDTEPICPFSAKTNFHSTDQSQNFVHFFYCLFCSTYLAFLFFGISDIQYFGSSAFWPFGILVFRCFGFRIVVFEI